MRVIHQRLALSISPVQSCLFAILLMLLGSASLRLAAQEPLPTPEPMRLPERPGQTPAQEPHAAGQMEVTRTPEGFCPASQPPIRGLSGNIFRPTIKGDYMILEFNAAPTSLQTRWIDYKQAWYEPHRDYSTPQLIRRNGTFLPVVYTREKILVHVCGLRFTDLVSVSITGAGLPENAFDFRGATPTTPIPAVAAALDSLQSVGITGVTSSIGGLGFGATPAISSAGVTGITPGTLSNGSNGLSYSDTNITASPEELAAWMYAAYQNSVQLADTIERDYKVNPDITKLAANIASIPNLQQALSTVQDIDLKIAAKPGSATKQESTLSEVAHALPAARASFQHEPPNQFNYIFLEAFNQLNEVTEHRATNSIFRQSPAAFDRDLTNVQNLSNQMTSFFAALAAQGFGARAIAIWNNYALLRGPLGLIEKHAYTTNCIPKDKATDAQLKLHAAEVADAAADKDVTDAQKTLDGLVTSHAAAPVIAAAQQDLNSKKLIKVGKDKALLQADVPPDNPDGPVRPAANCDTWEAANADQFIDEYLQQLQHLIDVGPPTTETFDAWQRNPTRMFKDLTDLQSSTHTLADLTNTLYAQINEWNEDSSIEQTDFVTPTTGNALERISIAVQRGFVPFTLTTNGTSTAPTIAAAVAPTVNTTASTSTPAHSVKTILVEVHRRANFNLEGAAIVIKVPTASYSVQTSPTQATSSSTQVTSSAGSPNPTVVLTSSNTAASPYTYTYTYTYAYNQAFSGTCNNGPSQTFSSSVTYATTTITNSTGGAAPAAPAPAPNAPAITTTPAYGCIITNQYANKQLVGMAGVVWYPGGRDYFPLRNGFNFKTRDLIPGLYAGTSVTSLGNVFLGFNVEPVSGFSGQIGWGMANTTVLPAGITSTSVLPSGYALQTITQTHWKLAFGFGIDLGIFGSIFKGTGGASLP